MAVHSKKNTVLTDKVTLECGWLAISPQPQTLMQAETDDDSPLLRTMPSITSSLDPRDLIARCSRLVKAVLKTVKYLSRGAGQGSLGREIRATRGKLPCEGCHAIERLRGHCR